MSNEPLEVWIQVEYPGYDYTSPIGIENFATGPLTAYHRLFIDVSDEDPTESSLTVIQPKGGEYLEVGGDYEITWESEGPIDDVRIDLSTNGGSTYDFEITPSTPNDGALHWTIPDRPTTEARILITALNVPGIADDSDENFTIWTPASNFIYGFSDSGPFEYCYWNDNATLFMNMLNLPLEGPYANNELVRWYEPHTKGYRNFEDFQELIEDLGYMYEYVESEPFVPINTEGVKMLIIATYLATDMEYSHEEIVEIEELLDGGGIVIILLDYPGCYTDEGYNTVDKLLVDLGAQFSIQHREEISGQYVFTDITSDPITAGVEEWYGSLAGLFDVFGDGISLIRADDGRTTVCKSPW